MDPLPREAWQLMDEEEDEQEIEQKQHPLLVKILIVAAIVITVLILFRIKTSVVTIDVTGCKHYSKEQICSLAGVNVGMSRFSVNEKTIKERLSSERYLVFDEVTLNDGNLVLRVHERVCRARFQIGSVYYLMDEEGMVLEKLDANSTGSAYPIVGGLHVRSARVGNVIVPSLTNQLSAYQDVMLELIEQNFLSQVSELNLTSVSSIYLTLRTGYTVQLGDPDDVRAKIGTLRAVLPNLQSMRVQGGVIDVTIPGNAVYSPN